MNQKALILSIPMILAALLLGGWFLMREPKSVPESQNPPVVKENPSQMAPADFAKYNKTLPRHKVTGVKDLEGPYKKVTVSNGAITFSFEVPDKWLTETRNSGEVQMNEEELREFLKSSYFDFNTDADVDALNMREMQNYISRFRNKLSSGLPNATVSSGAKKTIWYTDIGWDQVNFYILDEKTDASYLPGVTYSKNVAEIKEKYRNFETILQKEVQRDKEGKPVIDKGDTWGFGAYIKQKNFVVRIWKEAYVEGEFEEGFKHLIDTLSFE